MTQTRLADGLRLRVALRVCDSPRESGSPAPAYGIMRCPPCTCRFGTCTAATNVPSLCRVVQSNFQDNSVPPSIGEEKNPRGRRASGHAFPAAPHSRASGLLQDWPDCASRHSSSSCRTTFSSRVLLSGGGVFLSCSNSTGDCSRASSI